MYIRNLAWLEAVDQAEIRREIHDMRVKGWWVTGDNKGMHKTHSLEYTQNQAEKLICQAKKLMEAAEGMLKASQEPLTERQQRIWDRLDWKDLPSLEPEKQWNFINEKGEEINEDC